MSRSVSVIIPTYNRAHFLSEAIESVLAQDIYSDDIEIIVVDDGSTDNTQDVVASFGDKIKYIYQTNQGAGRARNRGIEESTAEWIAFLDSDDRWLPDKLSLQFKVLEAFPDYRVIHSNFYTFEHDKVVIPKGLEYWVETAKGAGEVDWVEFYNKPFKSSDYSITQAGVPFDIYAGNLFRTFIEAPCAACWTLLVHRDCLNESVRFAENYPILEDWWFFCRLSENHDFLFMNCATAENRGHTGPRVSQIQRAKFLECYLDMCKQIYFPSASPRRPTDEIISKHYRIACTALFKEYLKNGELLRAKEFAKSVVEFNGFKSDSTLPLYRIAAFLPFDIIGRLVKLKKKVIGK